jgi:hypothetical protein
MDANAMEKKENKKIVENSKVDYVIAFCFVMHYIPFILILSFNQNDANRSTNSFFFLFCILSCTTQYC